MAKLSSTNQRNAVSEGIALGLLMLDHNEIPYNKLRVDLSFEGAWREWPFQQRYSQVGTDLRKGLGGSLAMTRATETKQTWVLYWARERSLIICQRTSDWDPNDDDDLAYALDMVDREVPLEAWTSLAQSFLERMKL